MRKSHWIVLVILAFCFFSVLIGFFSLNKGEKIALGKKEALAVVNIQGEIIGGSGGISVLGQTPGTDNILQQLQQIKKDPEIKGVLLRINSPGGSSAASQEIYEELKKIRKSGKIIVASMGDVAASGGYMIACGADKIVANPSTMTGSIGVIMSFQNIEQLFHKLGIDSEVIKSGKYKDIGSDKRAMTAEERKLLQTMVDDVYGQFVDIVAKERKISREKVLAIADGRIFTGRQAQKIGLVDSLGNYYDALDLLAKMTNIKGEPVLKDYDKGSFPLNF